jgi:2-polyprenyl-6-methoxyphenol hydroxylase-like FAD-dependent oxidoreductase
MPAEAGFPHVVIAGAGPAGAATALLLARAGLRVTLLEREPDFERVFRGEGLMPTGLDALHQMGLRAALGEIPWRHLDAWEIFLDRREIMRVAEPTHELGDLALRVVAQAKLLEQIVREASRYPGFVFAPGRTIRDLRWSDDRRRVQGVRFSTPAGGEEALEADLVIGADGRSSIVRKRAGLELTLLPESYDVLWFKLPAAPGSESRCPVQIFASGPDVALAYVSWDGRLQVAWLLPKGRWATLRTTDWLADLMALLPAPLAAHVRASRAALEGPVLLDVIVGRCPRWSVPGLLLIGDAAHPMSPVRAQGINMALRDAIVVANLVPPALQADDASRACQAVQREREPEIARIQTLQLRELRGQRWARQRRWLMRPLLTVAPFFTRRPWVQRAWLRQQRELRFGVTRVELMDRRSPTGPLA